MEVAIGVGRGCGIIFVYVTTMHCRQLFACFLRAKVPVIILNLSHEASFNYGAAK